MKKILWLLLLILPTFVLGQSVVKLQLLDSLTKQPVVFANVGVPNKGIGTVSDDNGHFKLTIGDSLLTNTIKISCIGYASKTITVKQALGKNTLLLTSSATKLNEVIVRPSKATKYKTLGNKTETKNVIAGFKSNGLGAELAVKINIKHNYTQIKKLRFNLVKNSFENVQFRFNVYNKDANGNPADNIVKQLILTPKISGPGLVEFDLTPYAIYASDDIFIALEWIKDLGDINGLMFSTKMLAAPTYVKNASQGNWKHIPSVSVGISVDVEY